MLLTCFIIIVLVITTVLVHNECLLFIKRNIVDTSSIPRRWYVALTVMLLLLAHTVEIILFSTGYYIAVHVFELGEIEDAVSDDIASLLYYSFSSYTSLGIGDLRPIGMIRLITGIEALLGLLMIGWSASFLYLEMRSLWNRT